ncbi:hypothetical protein CW731_09445 [Polaribacter sp. ALD11]|uniref:T9SS type A sorting domain-containing protein n=1 Tax=Polaribacter sp. ALD11 TaxID=2058137 RepID=UPI000C30A4A3|nr:T9SS type A sorting domain-containing protein [Polaribacter sp. ALD11]AUC85499.1 hypothetical protein CW731_09445 [Polaribacter sp. ALD11]
MKKNYIFTLLLTLITALSFGQEMLLNGGLENWDDDATPTSWTKAEEITKSTDAHSGSFSAFRDGITKTKDLGQTIAGVVPGESYTVSFWYKVTAGDGEDARIWSAWKNGSTTVYHTENSTTDVLRGPENGYLDNNGGVWTKHEVTVTAPAGVNAFYFEVRSYKTSTTYFDDLSFVKNATASVENNSIEGFTTYPNPIRNNEFTVSSASNSEKTINVFNLLGKKVLSTSFTGVKSTINVSAMNAGIYILKVTEEGRTATRKLVVR